MLCPFGFSHLLEQLDALQSNHIKIDNEQDAPQADSNVKRLDEILQPTDNPILQHTSNSEVEDDSDFNTYSHTTDRPQEPNVTNEIVQTNEESITDVDSLTSELSEEDLSDLEEDINFDHETEDLQADDLDVKIIAKHIAMNDRQSKINMRQDYKAPRGRKRAKLPENSQELNNLVKKYFREGIQDLQNNKSRKRRDASLKAFLRLVKKLPLFLVENCGSKNKYKHNNLLDYSAAYSESHCSFLFSINDFNEERILRSYIEYVVIYFPPSKVIRLFRHLIRQNPNEQDFIVRQHENLEKREKCSIRNIRRWAQSSQTFSNILRIALSVLREDCFSGNKSIQHLANTTSNFLRP